MLTHNVLLRQLRSFYLFMQGGALNEYKSFLLFVITLLSSIGKNEHLTAKCPKEQGLEQSHAFANLQEI